MQPFEASILTEFDCREEHFEHRAANGVSVEWSLLLPRTADALIDEVAFASDERLPYWADLWPSAKALARYLLDVPSLPARAVELGCGVGLPSLALLWRRVETIATDYEPAALRFVEVNARRNFLARPTCVPFDWRSGPPFEPAPLVVAADVLYEERHAIALSRSLPNLVAPDGIALVADPQRHWLDLFITLMRAAGWTASDCASRREPGTAPGASPSAVRIVRLRRASDASDG